MNTTAAYRELRAWAVKWGVELRISDIRPRYKKEAHIRTGTAFSSKPLTEIEFGCALREHFDYTRELERRARMRARKIRPLFM